MTDAKKPPVERPLLVLVVEDEPFIAMDMEDTLRNAGHNVLGPACSVAMALKLVKEMKPDVAVLDVNLGGERVTPVVEALKDQNVPILLASGSHVQLREGVLRGISNLGKPTPANLLLRAISSIARKV